MKDSRNVIYYFFSICAIYSKSIFMYVMRLVSVRRQVKRKINMIEPWFLFQQVFITTRKFGTTFKPSAYLFVFHSIYASLIQMSQKNRLPFCHFLKTCCSWNYPFLSLVPCFLDALLELCQTKLIFVNKNKSILSSKQNAQQFKLISKY